MLELFYLTHNKDLHNNNNCTLQKILSSRKFNETTNKKNKICCCWLPITTNKLFKSSSGSLPMVGWPFTFLSSYS